jgi:hypothetical protein
VTRDDTDERSARSPRAVLTALRAAMAGRGVIFTVIATHPTTGPPPHPRFFYRPLVCQLRLLLLASHAAGRGMWSAQGSAQATPWSALRIRRSTSSKSNWRR